MSRWIIGLICVLEIGGLAVVCLTDDTTLHQAVILGQALIILAEAIVLLWRELKR